jgi:tetratricopeptide (TPR) repeat protein
MFAGGVAAVVLGADDLSAVKESAVRLYDQGNYDEARTSLKQLDDAHALDGPLLYRLFFCEKATGHDDDARKALDRARAALETEIPAARSLEDSFYLANTYTNLGRTEDARKIAHDATAKLESGGTRAPTTAIGQFQLGKLYQDQGRQTEAATAYAKAVETFDLSEGRYGVNLRWALRYLGSSAYTRGDFAASESSLARLTALGGAEAADWDVLAASRVRLGKFVQASEAWRAQVKLDPANADDPRYSARLAETAAALQPLPATAAGGPAFTAMSRTDLEVFLKARSQVAIDAQSRVAEAMQPDKDGGPRRSLDPKLRAELARTLAETRRQFVAAGLEYALRRYGIRETAFREGYAVLIFQDRAWELPPDPEAAAGPTPGGGS